MNLPRPESVEIRPRPAGRAEPRAGVPQPRAGAAEVEVRLSNGKTVLLLAATPEAAPDWLAGEGLAWGPPVLYVRTLEPEAVRGAVEAMAADLSGYWLRYYGSATKEREAGG